MILLMYLLCTKYNFDYWSKFTMFDFFIRNGGSTVI